MTNSACNMTGTDPLFFSPSRARPRGAIKRHGDCDALIDRIGTFLRTGETGELGRARWAALCGDSAAVAREVEAKDQGRAGRSEAITAGYRQPRGELTPPAQHGLVAATVVALLGDGSIAQLVRDSPFKLTASVVGVACAAIYWRESANPATSRMRLLHTRIYGQAVAVVTTVCVLGLAEVLDRGASTASSGRQG